MFNVEQNLTVTIAGVTIANGNSDTGGGIYNRGTLTLTNSTTGFKADYQVERTVNKRVMKKVKFVAAYNQLTNSVTLTLKGQPTFPKGGQITVIASAPKGVRSTAGVLLDSSDTVFTIQAKAKGITPG